MVDAGKITPVIDTVFDFNQEGVNAAFAKLKSRRYVFSRTIHICQTQELMLLAWVLLQGLLVNFLIAIYTCICICMYIHTHHEHMLLMPISRANAGCVVAVAGLLVNF
jgi:hypothetical protein